MTSNADNTPVTPQREPSPGNSDSDSTSLPSTTPFPELPDVLRIMGSGTGVDNLLTNLFNEWGVMTWDDLSLFNLAAIDEWIDSNQSLSGPLSIPATVRRLRYLIQYANLGEKMTTTTTMPLMIKTIRANETAGHIASSLAPTSSSSSNKESKKTMPTLPPFTGIDDDWFAWKEKTETALGCEGLIKYLTNFTLSLANPESGEAVFYCLKSALAEGHAHYLAKKLIDQNNLCPATLWSNLKKYFDTDLNRANIVLIRFVLQFGKGSFGPCGASRTPHRRLGQ